MSQWQGLNRRRFPRVNYPCLVVIQGKEDNDKLILLTHTENIGIGGVCVLLKQNLKMFSAVEMEIDLLDMGNHIKCQGMVVWNIRRKLDDSNKPVLFDVGVEFENLDKKDQDRIDEVLMRLEKKGK